MKRNTERGRALRALIFAISCIIVFGLFILIYIAEQERDFFQYQAKRHAVELQNEVSIRLTDSLAGIAADQDEINARRIILREMNNPEIEAIALFDRNGDFLEGMQRLQNDELVPWEDIHRQGTLSSEFNLYQESEFVGHVLVTLTPKRVQAFLRLAAERYFARTALMALLLLWSCAVCGLFAYSLGRTITRNSPRRALIRRSHARHPLRPDIPKRRVRPRYQTLNQNRTFWKRIFCHKRKQANTAAQK